MSPMPSLSISNKKKSEIIELSNGRKLRGKQFVCKTKLPNNLSNKHKLNFETKKLTMNAFLNIPFGEPPIGELRFKRPLPAKPWPIDHILDCTKFGPRCPHKDLVTEVFTGFFNPKNENCLHLNVFTPYTNLNKELKNLPIMVFIHGGGFVIHSASHYGDIGICKNLCTKNIIVVTIQYRLGFFGFLSTGDDLAPGNMGLWDQTLALQWIYDNIAAFGGDPNNITVCGQSAGAASTEFLALSPYSRDLFQKMIVISGSALCTFALNTQEHVRNACIEFAKEKGFVVDNKLSIRKQNEAMLDFYRKLPANKLELSFIGNRRSKINRDGKLDLTPVIDGDFLPEPIEILRKKVPKKFIFTGVTEYESLLFTLTPFKSSLKKKVFNLITKEYFAHNIQPTDSDHEKIINLYFKENNKNNFDHKISTKTLIKLASDILIVNGVWNFADSMTQLGHSVYLYSFEHFHKNSFGLAGFLFPFKGATHCTELQYIFLKNVVGKFNKTEKEMEIANRFSSLITNFVKTGNPNNPENNILNALWTPLDTNNTHKYLRITSDKETTIMNENFFERRPEICRQIFQTYKSNNLNPKL